MYLGGIGAYYLKNGVPASSLNVGDTMGFNVPGYSQVWLDQTQNGTPQYSGPFNVPMAPYVLQSRDVGTFNASVYELNAGGQKGKLLGTDSIQVSAPGAAPTVQAQTIYAPPTIQANLAPEYSNVGPATGGPAMLMPSGAATPSAPPLPVVVGPSAPVDFGTIPTEATPAPETEAAGFGGFDLSTVLLIGLGLYFVFGGKRR